MPEDQGKRIQNVRIAGSDSSPVQWWNSFIFAVFGAAILIGSRKCQLTALWLAKVDLFCKQYVAGLLIIHLIAP